MKTPPSLMSINVSAQQKVNRNLLNTLENLSFSNHLTYLGRGGKARKRGERNKADIPFYIYEATIVG